MAAAALAGTALSAIGTGVGALQANAQARYQARVADQNASMEREAARQEQQNTHDAALAQYRRIGDLKGRQRAGAAANGVLTDFGTAANMIDDTDALGAEDVSRIYRQGEQAVRGHDLNAANYRSEAGAQRQAGTGALVGGALQFGSTVLGGASQYAKLNDKLGTVARLTPSARKTIGSYPGIF